jgi:NhaP-type Na+/H+ and K+/H+ antiporter
MKREKFDELSGAEKYKLYLNTEQWKKISEKLREEEKKCCICGKKYNLSVHHVSYKRLKYGTPGNEDRSDVVVLCDMCHSRAHRKDNLFFIVMESEEDANLFNDLVATSKARNFELSDVYAVGENKTKLYDYISGKVKKKKNKSSGRLERIYMVFRNNWMYDLKDGRRDVPWKAFFKSRLEAEKYKNEHRYEYSDRLTVREVNLH